MQKRTFFGLWASISRKPWSGPRMFFDQLKSLSGWLLWENFFVAEQIRVFEINGAKHGSLKSGFSVFSGLAVNIFCHLKWGYVWVFRIGVPNFREYRSKNWKWCSLYFWRAIALQWGGLEKDPLVFSHISMRATSPWNFSQIGDMACAAVCRWSAGFYRQTQLT